MQACTVQVVGIDQETVVIVYRLTATGVMTDSGANACMADLETHLVDCHRIRPVTVGLTLAAQTDPTMHICDRMGYMVFTREGGGLHGQSFPVNHQATDCIMLPDAIAHQTADCVRSNQEGHVGEEPGSLVYFDVHDKRILYLRLRKCSGLYYCDVEGMSAPHTKDTFNRITDDWVTVVDSLQTDTEVVDAWVTVARVERIIPKRLLQREHGAPRLPPKIPMLPELLTFEPMLDLLAEQPFVPDGRTIQRPRVDDVTWDQAGMSRADQAVDRTTISKLATQEK